MNILFLGNSLIFYHDLPSIFSDLAQTMGKEVSVSSVTKGSATISDFADAETEVGKRAYDLLSSQAWDIVILEPSRRITPYDDTVLLCEIDGAKKLQALAAAAGATVLLYAVWGNASGELRIFTAETPIRMTKGESRPITRWAHAQFMHDMSHRISDELGGVPIVEAGYAFENLLAVDDTINLYHTDLRHPSLAGSYLTACAFYAKIFGEKTEGSPNIRALPNAEQLQKIADMTVLEGVYPVNGEG